MNQNTASAIIPAIIAFFGVIIGSVLTHLTNIKVEMFRTRSQLSQRRINEAYIPLCSAIEQHKIQYSWFTNRVNFNSPFGILSYYRNNEEFERLINTVIASSNARIRWLFVEKDREHIDNLMAHISYIERYLHEGLDRVHKYDNKVYFTPESSTQEYSLVEVSFDDYVSALQQPEFDMLELFIERDEFLKDDLIEIRRKIIEEYDEINKSASDAYIELLKTIDKQVS